MVKRLQWAFATRAITATDDDARLYAYWNPVNGWQFGTVPPAVPWPKHQFRLYMVFSTLHDMNIILKDGSVVLGGFLGPQANAMIEAGAVVQSGEVPGYYRDWERGLVIDTGVCFQLPLGSHVVTDQWYNTILYEDVGQS